MLHVESGEWEGSTSAAADAPLLHGVEDPEEMDTLFSGHFPRAFSYSLITAMSVYK